MRVTKALVRRRRNGRPAASAALLLIGCLLLAAVFDGAGATAAMRSVEVAGDRGALDLQSDDLFESAEDALEGEGDVLEGAGDLLESEGDVLESAEDMLEGEGDSLGDEGDEEGEGGEEDAPEGAGDGGSGAAVAPVATGPPSVSAVSGERGATRYQIAWVEETLEDVVELFGSRWSLAGLPSVRAQVHVTRWAQRNALRHVLGDSYAPELHWCSQPYRTAPGARWTIAYLFGCSRSNFVLAHEYMRIIQNETGSREANLLEAPLWLTHGSAEWVEAVFESLHGGRSLEHSRAINRRAALVARETYALHDPSMCAECAPHYAAYTMGFVAVERLVELAGEKAIFDFWPRLKQAYESGDGFAEAFEATFGLSLARFYATFDIHLRGQRSWMVIS